MPTNFMFDVFAFLWVSNWLQWTKIAQYLTTQKCSDVVLNIQPK